MKNFIKILSAPLVLLAVLCLTASGQTPLTDNMPASGVLGQATLTTNASGFLSGAMNNVFGVAIDPTTGKLFVADRNNNRVLRFSSAAKMIDGSLPEAALGQPDLTTIIANGGGISATTMATPVRVYVDASGRLWVSDYGNRRVLRFDGASAKATGAAADGVLGQPDFATNSAGTTDAKMTRTTSLMVDGAGRLWVAERDNNRVLRFDSAATKANGASADGVLGQPDFTTGTAGTTSATSMSEPFGLFVDAAGTLWVGEDGNSRALRFDNAASKTNGAAADGVLGQPDFTTGTYSTTRTQTGNIRGIFGDALGRIYLVDEGNSRVMIYNNAATLVNGAPADYVLGQADFTSGAVASPPTAKSFAFPNSMFIDNTHNQIWIADAGNNRLLRFDVLAGNLAASGVLGTSDFVTNTNYASPSTTTLAEPAGVAVDPVSGKLFVADRDNRRVLRWSSAAKLLDGSAAEAVLGQPDFVTRTRNTGGLSASTTNDPNAVYVDGNGRLWVADMTNNRVLRFDDAAAKASSAAADGVLGQPDFLTNTTGTTAAKMNTPTSIFVDGSGTLWVADKGNNRVLRFAAAAGKANGANADGVLGQTLFTTSTAGGAGADSLNLPWGVYVDGAGKLWVADRGHSRVLRFDNAAAKANGAAADGVLGQTNFVTGSFAKTQSGLGEPRGVCGDGLGNLYVADEGNTRIMVYSNAAAKANGANADYVIGQSDFTSDASSTTATSLNYPPAVFVDGPHNHVWVPDTYNHRVLRFDVNTGGPTTGVTERPDQMPTDYALAQNYPNPFNPGTTITFALKTTEHATVTVYNVLGQSIATLFDGVARANERYALSFNASNLPSGVYFYTLRSATRNEAKKMVLMK